MARLVLGGFSIVAPMIIIARHHHCGGIGAKGSARGVKRGMVRDGPLAERGKGASTELTGRAFPVSFPHFKPASNAPDVTFHRVSMQQGSTSFKYSQRR